MKKIVGFLMVLALMTASSFGFAADKDTAREFNETKCLCC